MRYEDDKRAYTDLTHEEIESKKSPIRCTLKSITGQSLQIMDPVAESMSKEQPDTPIITVYINGVQMTVPLKSLLPL